MTAAPLTTIGFDADDTLWQNESFFRLTQDRFTTLLADHAERVRRRVLRQFDVAGITVHLQRATGEAGGLRLGVSGSEERMPCCARVVYEYLGPRVGARRALRLCGLFDVEDPRIDAATRRAITNDMAPSEWHFRARF